MKNNYYSNKHRKYSLIQFIKDYWLLMLLTIVDFAGVSGGITILIDCCNKEYTSQILRFGYYQEKIQLLNQVTNEIIGSSLIGACVGSLIVIGIYLILKVFGDK